MALSPRRRPGFQSPGQQRGLLLHKQLSDRRVKLILHKLQETIKAQLGFSQDQINQVAQLDAGELQSLEDEQRKFEQEVG